MGLATTQARFLGITARKADCEYKSTELAQEKLEITNQLSGVASEYSNAMNSTKLIWQNDAVDQAYGVTYSLLMTPSAANDFNPYMITTTSGAVVLNSEYAAAAKVAGISKAGGVGSQTGRDKFIAALVPGGIVTQETANAITKTDYTGVKAADGSVTLTDITGTDAANYKSVQWNPSAGMGAEPMDKASASAMQLSDLILSESIGQQPIDWAQLYTPDDQLTQVEYDRQIAIYDADIKDARRAGNDQEVERLTAAKNAYKAANPSVTNFDSNQFQTEKNEIQGGGANTIVQNGIINHYEDELKGMTIGDLLSGNIVLMAAGDGTQDAKKMAEKVEKLLESIASVLGLGQSGVGLNVDDASANALKYAMTMTKNVFLKSQNAIKAGSRNSNKSMTDNSAYLNATENNRIGQGGGYTAVSLSNMTSSFLTYFDNYLNGSNSNYVVGKSVETSAFVTDNKGYYYIGQSDTNAPKLNEKWADFFDELYNNICEHGWREDATVDDSEYLESAIKDGRYSMSSLNNDGYYYQTRYNETGYMKEVSDTDAIARAEAEYTQKKAELTYKEDSMDMKAKKLDAEISTLSTEYDTVKNLISKNIEKTFTMFSG